jgi:steroid delta-isomerase-like uncharacterized protein
MTIDDAPGAGLDLEWLDAFAADFLAAWNSRDVDALLALMTEDVVYDDSAWPAQMRGQDDVRAFLTAIWRAVPDLTFSFVEHPYVVPGKPKAAFHWRATGTFTGPLDPPGYAPTGRSATWEGIDLQEYRDHRIARLRTEFDLMDLSRQLGLLPAQGSRAEQALTRVQRAAMRVRRR